MNVEKILSTDRIALKKMILNYFNRNTFFRSETLAKDLLALKHDISYSRMEYDLVVKNWTKKISKILKELEEKGKLSIYKKTNRGYLYKRKEKKKT